MELQVAGKRVHAGSGGRRFDTALPTVVFLHGAGMDHTVWALQARYLAHHGCGVLALDLPGHGGSEGPPLASVEDLAVWVWAALDAAGVEMAALAGHSLGALTALEAAARQPERTTALALLGVAEAMPVHPDLLAAAAANDHGAIDMVNAWAHGAGAHIGGHPAPGTWLLGGGNRLLERAAPGVLHAGLAACDAYKAAPRRAAEVTCPVLLLLGALDKMTPAKAGRKLAETFSAAASTRVEVLPACGHMMMTERPDATLDALITLL
ncbi:MAG: alpha/beta hydrolase [Rhodovibrionaceae bacterium]